MQNWKTKAGNELTTKILSLGLERELGGKKSVLLLQRTQVQYLELMGTQNCM